MSKPIVKNWLILFAIIAIPSVGAYVYFDDSDNIDLSFAFPQNSVATSDISELIEESQERAKSDYQNIIDARNSSTAITDRPTRNIVEKVTDSGVKITTSHVMTEPFDPFAIEWNEVIAMRAENVLPQETQQKFDKIIYEFTEGNLAYVWNNCDDMITWYEFYYFGGGKNVDGLWSYNQKITDVFKYRLSELECTYYELPEGNKEKLDEQQADIQDALEWLDKEQQRYDDLYGKSG